MSFLNKLVVAGIALGCAGFGTGVGAITAEEQADIASQCRQEAELYGVAEEQRGEYVEGCILAMGGMPEAVSGDTAFEGVSGGEASVEEVNVEEVGVDTEESGYPDGEEDAAP